MLKKFLDDFLKKKDQLLEISSEYSNPEEITFKQEADFWLTHSESRNFCQSPVEGDWHIKKF